MVSRAGAFTLALLISFVLPARVRSQPFADWLVQPPQIANPQRGSLAGALAREAFGPGELGSGAYSMHLPVEAPTERGPLSADPFPTYSPEHGLGEWGLGWHAAISIYRFRTSGHLDYRTDERAGPWGRMAKGSDGAWYPVGLRTTVRVVERGDTLLANLPDGSVWTFGAATHETTAEGTYAWMLDSVQTVDDARTSFSYSMHDGRAWLERVDYGGVGTNFQERIQLGYEAVARPFVTYRSGERAAISRRVTSIEILSRDAKTLTFVRRWRYLLGYDQDAWGAAYYLSKIQREFASGVREPAISLSYRKPTETIAAATFGRIDKLQDALGALTVEVLQPHKSAPFDLGLDGLVDLEVAADTSVIRRTASGFRHESPLPVPANVDAQCRPPVDSANAPRMIANVSPLGEPRVISLVTDGSASNTDLRVCSRDGTQLGRQRLGGRWDLGALTRLVDLTGDGTPELVRLDRGRVAIRIGASSGDKLVFGDEVVQKISPDVPIETLWVHDWNGDGIADLVARSQSELIVWFGRGRGRFAPLGQTVAFQTAAGPLSDLRHWQISFVDINHDGATDAVLTQASTASLFVNDGTALVERRVPAFSTLDWRSGAPLVLDLSGRGEVEIAGLRGAEVWAVDLTEPGAALLSAVDDGRGMTRTMRYGRAAAVPSLRARPVVLESLTIAAAGEPSLVSDYRYADPSVDPTTGAFIGFRQVRRQTPHRADEVELLQTSIASGLVVHQINVDDREPDLQSETTTTYDAVKFRGVDAMRKRDEHALWRSISRATTALGPWTEYVSYRDTCPVVIRRHVGADVLVTTSTIASVTQLGQSVHCLEATRVIEGKHANSAFDFAYTIAQARDVAGRVTAITARGASDVLGLQQIHYNAAGLVQSIDSIDRGSSTLAWDVSTRQLLASTDSVGVSLGVRRGALSSQVEQLHRDLGGVSSVETFTYDGFERLATSFDDQGKANAAQSNLSYEYEFSTPNRPGRIRTRALVDAASASTRDTIDLLTPSGRSLVTLRHAPTAWTLPTISRSRDEGVLETILRSPLTPTDLPEQLTYAALDQGGVSVGRETTTPNGLLERAIQQHADSRYVEHHRREISNGTLTEVVELAGNVAHTLGVGPDGRVRERVEVDGARSSYGWDLMGRVRSVQLPDGRRADISYDAVGRLSAVQWRGWMTIKYAYRAGSTLPSRKDVLSPVGTLLQRTTYSYDAKGRVVSRLHSEPGKPDREFKFAYDTAPAACGWVARELGHAMMEAGPGYLSCVKRDALDRVTTRTDTIEGQLTLATELAYFEDGTVRHETRRLTRPSLPITTLTIDRATDRMGRVTEVRIADGQTISVAYDARDRPIRASTPTATVWVERDPVTDLATGIGGTTASRSWKQVVHLAPSGAPDSDRYTFDGSSTLVKHTVTPRGFLEATTGASSWRFDYSSTGILQGITTDGVRANVAHPAMDALGRVAQVSGASVEYGADSQAVSVTKPGSPAWTFVSDADGQQRARLVDGKLERAEIGGVYVIGDRIYWPFALDGRLLGYVTGGSFEAFVGDSHGTAFADPARVRALSPYGVGSRVQGVLDFHGGPAQPAIDGLRFGARDFVPALGSFLTPDLSFVEAPERCVEHGLDCNLYGFANSNPSKFSDVSGAASTSDYIVGLASEDTWYRLTRTAVFIADHTVPGVMENAWFKELTGWNDSVGSNVAEIRSSSEYRDHSQAMDFAISILISLSGNGGRTRGGAGPGRVGRAWEAAARKAYTEERIGARESYTIEGRSRISDGANASELFEVKGTKSQARTQQLVDHMQQARDTGRVPALLIRPDTKLTAPLIDEWLEGNISIGDIPMGPK